MTQQQQQHNAPQQHNKNTRSTNKNEAKMITSKIKMIQQQPTVTKNNYNNTRT